MTGSGVARTAGAASVPSPNCPDESSPQHHTAAASMAQVWSSPAEICDTPVSPADLAATIYTTLGVNLHTWYKAQDGRPIELCPEGKPVKDLVG